jgi:hypothetical protein
MGKETRKVHGARRVVALCTLATAATLGVGAILQAPAPVRGSLRGPDDGGKPLESVAPARSPRVLPTIALSSEAHSWLKRSFELIAHAQYGEARASCRALIPLSSPSVVAACVAPIDGLTGRYEVARHSLENALPAAGSLEQQIWLYSLLGELAFWNGDLTRAEQALGSALALAPAQRDLLALHVDLLLDTGRARQALSMLAGQDADNGMLLREMLAYQRLGLTQAARSCALRLQQRFVQAQARGEAVSARDEARFYASLPGQEPRALELAQAAFGMQQEPWEVRLLLETSLNAGRPRAAQPALDWLARTGIESPALQLLAAQLTATR